MLANLLKAEAPPPPTEDPEFRKADATLADATARLQRARERLAAVQPPRPSGTLMSTKLTRQEREAQEALDDVVEDVEKAKAIHNAAREAAIQRRLPWRQERYRAMTERLCSSMLTLGEAYADVLREYAEANEEGVRLAFLAMPGFDPDRTGVEGVHSWIARIRREVGL